MRVITKGALRSFWDVYPDSEQELKTWYDKIKNTTYLNSNEVIAAFPKADVLGNNRIVFNICHNKYRLIALFRYRINTVFIRFLGTHREYDFLINIKNI